MATSRLALSRVGMTAPASGRGPIGIHESQFDDVAERDYPYEGHHYPFDVPVPSGGDEQDLEDGGDHGAGKERQPEEDLKAERPAQQFGHVGGDAGHDDAAPEEGGPRPGETLADVVGQAVARHYPQPGRHALEEDQHERPQRDDPQQRVAELAPAGHVGRPVARVDEADGDDEPRSQVAQEVAVEEDAKNARPLPLAPASSLLGHPRRHPVRAGDRRGNAGNSGW